MITRDYNEALAPKLFHAAFSEVGMVGVYDWLHMTILIAASGDYCIESPLMKNVYKGCLWSCLYIENTTTDVHIRRDRIERV